MLIDNKIKATSLEFSLVYLSPQDDLAVCKNYFLTVIHNFHDGLNCTLTYVH